MKLYRVLLGIAALIISTSFSPSTKSVIVIDAAHGGSDNGSVTPNVMEKQITLSIAQKIKALNDDRDIEVVLIRNQDEDMSLEQRNKKIQNLKPSLVISLHANFTNEDITKSGTEIFISKQNKHYDVSSNQAQLLLKVWTGQGKNDITILDKNLNLLSNANCPAMAIELGYLSNEKDRNYLMSNSGQEEITKTINTFLAKQ
ncbi:MAG: N-acetylmuramoyl-L-alanine amidase [Bacteroidota bacterium]